LIKFKQSNRLTAAGAKFLIPAISGVRQYDALGDARGMIGNRKRHCDLAIVLLAEPTASRRPPNACLFSSRGQPFVTQFFTRSPCSEIGVLL
jgi:hypothetical protein